MTVFEKSKFQIDFDEMESKCHANHYRIAEEFRADAQLVVHNTVIFHGGLNNNRFKAKISRSFVDQSHEIGLKGGRKICSKKVQT